MSNQVAPDPLELVRAFVNTRDVEEGTDELADPRAAAAWLRDHDLLGEGGLDDDELARLVTLREALRALLIANNHEAPPPADALEIVNREAAEASLIFRFEPGGPVAATDARCSGLSAAVGRLLAIVADAMREGGWSRLKVCPNDECLWAFYDRSRNRSRTWCSMGVCGNRMKARSFRERQRASK